jgi:hypothetical protein
MHCRPAAHDVERLVDEGERGGRALLEERVRDAGVSETRGAERE